MRYLRRVSHIHEYIWHKATFDFRREIMANIYLKNLVDSWEETLTKEQLAERQQALADRLEQVTTDYQNNVTP